MNSQHNNPTNQPETGEPWARYARQMRYAPLGEEGQRKLAASRALVCGCGALGTALANTLVRAGVGTVRIVDRDFVDITNLQRQVLFDEDDCRQGTPKAIAATAKLRAINSQVAIEPIVAHVDVDNIHSLIDGVDCILDGTDNFETRFLLNDAAVQSNIPWVYGGCLGAEGQCMAILPGKTACLRCLMPEPPPAGSMPTCDTAGVLAPIVAVVAAYQAMEGLKILSGRLQAVSPLLTVFEMWDNRVRQLRVPRLDGAVRCPTCVVGEFPWLTAERGQSAAVLCGRNAVQLSHVRQGRVDLPSLAAKLAPLGMVSHNAFLLRLVSDAYRLTLFGDGRAIIEGTDDVTTARALYDRWVGG